MEPFQTNLNDYLSTIRDAKAKGLSHDYLRQVFIEFARKNFKVDPTDVELEKGVKGAQLRGSIDALYQDIVFEFKRDLRLEGEKGKEELKRYLLSLGDKQVFFGVLTDALTFEVYIIQDSELAKIDEVNLKKLSPDDVFIWFDAFLFSQKQLTPTYQDVVKRFGDTSFVFNSSFRMLNQMMRLVKESPSYRVKFNEWDSLLAKAYGHSVARSELFLRHTYLSLLAKMLAYTALFSEKPKGQGLSGVITGKAFTNLPNLAEEDFFCWVLDPALQQDTLKVLSGLMQYLAAYDLSKVDEDLLKELYENLVDRETKHDLGEVYTPDWLAELTLREAGFSQGKRLLDPACGSGTFLFTAIRLLKEQGLSGTALVDEALGNIVGVEVHPLAVTIAKVNYLLALTPDVKSYGKTVNIPVYLADSLQGVTPTGKELITELIFIQVSETELFAIPRFMAENPNSLDQIIDEMRMRASGADEESALDGFSAYLERRGFKDVISFWRQNLRMMRKLVKEGRDTIWAFILKNYYRPAYLREHKVDIVAGNPPWLSYRYISEPSYQKQVKELIFHYGLLSRKEVKLFTQMEEATLFFSLSADAYLKKEGVIAFVMPRSVITGAKQHQHFQEALQSYHLPPMALKKLLDFEEVSPLFKVPACVLIAQKQGKVEEVARLILKGSLPKKNVKWAEAKKLLKRQSKEVASDKLFPPKLVGSVYLKDVKEGATLVPRSFWFVQPIAGPYGISHERPMLETSPEIDRLAKKPWQGIHLQGEVEAQYLYATMLSRQLLPFGFTGLSLVVLPIEDSPAGIRIVKKETAYARGHSGLHGWLSQVEKLWEGGRKERSPMDVYSRLDYQHLLTSQHLKGYYTVLYNRAGTNLASCAMTATGSQTSDINMSGFIADADTYSYQTKNESEVHFLCSFLNSAHVDQVIKPYQTRGAWGERDIHRRPFEYVPIPRFNPNDQRHQKLAEISQTCHEKVAQLHLEGKSIGFLRNKARVHVKAELEEIDKLVREILSPGTLAP